MPTPRCCSTIAAVPETIVPKDSATSLAHTRQHSYAARTDASFSLDRSARWCHDQIYEDQRTDRLVCGATHAGVRDGAGRAAKDT